MKRKMNRIQEVLERERRSQSWLADELVKKGISVTRQTINSYCNNKEQPRLDRLAEIADVLGVSPKSLIGDGSEIED